MPDRLFHLPISLPNRQRPVLLLGTLNVTTMASRGACDRMQLFGTSFASYHLSPRGSN